MDSRLAARPGQAQRIDNDNAMSALLICMVIVLTFPGALVGALITYSMWRVLRPDIVTKWLVAGLGVAAVAVAFASVEPAWPWRLILGGVFPQLDTGLTGQTIERSLLFEALLGPVTVTTFELELWWRRRTVQGREWIRYREMEERKKALEHGWAGPASQRADPGRTTAHPPGFIRLGVGANDGIPLDLGAHELAHHVFIPGGSGSGKTTTIARIAEGAIANGYGVVIVDCKGSGLGGTARRLAARSSLPFTIVDPRDPETIGYQPCTGDASAVANKLIGAFTFGGEAEIYKQVAMEVVPIICRALVASGDTVTLDKLYDSLSKGAMARLGRRPGAEAYRVRLDSLDEAGGVAAAGYVGLQRRLGALMEGTFGPVFRQEPALDWHAVMSRPQVTYFSLSATAASEDVDLFGRVIIQDLKQVCDERMRAIDRGESLMPVLIVFDEFAALREATQIVDLLLQARQALTPLVIATQYLAP
jgi:Type IV secretion-system coupling protein DNA-binding domain